MIRLQQGTFGPTFGPCMFTACSEQSVIGLMAAAITPQGAVSDSTIVCCAAHLPEFLQALGEQLPGVLGAADWTAQTDGGVVLPPEPEPDPDEPAYAVVQMDEDDRYAAAIVSTHRSYTDAVLSCKPQDRQRVGAYAWALASVTDAQMLRELSREADTDEGLHGPREILSGPYRDARVTVTGQFDVGSSEIIGSVEA